MRWLELSVEADVEAVEAVSEILGRFAEGSAVQPTRLLRDPDDELSARGDPAAPWLVTAHIPYGPESSRAIAAAERALWHLQAFGLRPLGELRVRSVDDGTWTDAWRQHYVAQRIGRIAVVPSWAEEPPREGETSIVLDPGMAFGTGLHPTTRGCLHLLQELDTLPESLLDVGSGSGILAIAALRLGARRATAVDTDPLAVEATRANAARNGLTVEARLGSLPDAADERYGLVVANLVATVLIELSARLAAHLAPGGVLVAGGIMAPRAGEVIPAFQAAGLRVVTTRQDAEWMSLRLRHAA